MYGYVILVANSLPMAPNKKMSRGVTFRLFSSIFFNCSNIVYCRMGLMTRTRAGKTPAKSAPGPSVRRRERRVETVEGLDLGAVAGSGNESLSSAAEEEDFRAVMRVLTTQMGFVIRTVALPAMAPAIMDSIVVRFLEARDERTAARSKNARVHSYPFPRGLLLALEL